MELSVNMRVIVPVAVVMTDMQGTPSMFTHGLVAAGAPERGEDMWWIEIALANGGTLPQIYRASEVIGVYVGP